MSSNIEVNDANKDKSDEEVDDYMSNDFLNQIIDTRPGLVFSRSQARRNELEKKHKSSSEESNQKNLQMSSKNLEKVNREEALKKSLLTEDTANKGLSLMKKMGYKTGEALGRQGDVVAVNKASIEPISVEIKLDRGGLGQIEEKKRKHEEIKQMRRSMIESRLQTGKQSEEAYLESKRNRFLLRKLVSDLRKCQKACYQLDTSEKDLKEPSVKWFWPINIRRSLKIAKSKEQNVEMPMTLEEPEQIELVMASTSSQDYYEKIINTDAKRPVINLKDAYNERLKAFISVAEDEQKDQAIYGSRGDTDSEEEQVFSAGFSAKARKEKNESSDIEEDEIDEEETLDNEEDLRKKIDLICSHLKSEYLYCIWCAVKYEDETQFKLNCPGPSEDDHE